MKKNISLDGIPEGQMYGFFDDLSKVGQNIIDGIRQEAIAGGTGAILAQPGVQQAITQKAQEQAAQTLAQKLLAQSKSLATTVQQYKTQIAILMIVLVVGGVVLYKRKK